MIAVRLSARWLLPALLVLPWQTAVPTSKDEPSPLTGLVEARRGNLPVVILAPHGGSLGIPGVAARQTGSRLTDSHTAELAEATAERVAALLGARPYTVIARFKRRYLDVNRSRAAGAESPRAAAVHDLYHGAVAAFVHEVRERFPGGALLLDIHGQKQEPATIFRGTRNGLTVSRMLRRHGSEALAGPRSVSGVLQSRGYRVSPPVFTPGAEDEHPGFAGGYTVQTYGSHHDRGIDAIQLEVGRGYRLDATRRNDLAADLAGAIAVYCRHYLRCED